MTFGRTKLITLWHPRQDEELTTVTVSSAEETQNETVQIDLYHPRAADPIRVRYDFERDGYAVFVERDAVSPRCGGMWTEVAFVKGNE